MTPDVRDTPRREPASGPPDPVAARHPAADDRPVEFWPTSAIRAALETDDLTVWQRIVAAIKRDPFGRTARQVEEVLQTARPYGVSKALAEVLGRTREHLEANERAEVARHIHTMLDRSGLGQQEFASRIGVPNNDFAAYLSGETSPSASLMVRMRKLSDRFAKMRSTRGATTRDLTLPTTFALIPGAGGSAWFWHRVTPLLAATGATAIPIELPAGDDAADLRRYADIAVESVAEVSGPLVLVGQSLGAFTAPIVATRVPTALIVLVNPMVPTAGESGGQWWENTGQQAARIAYFARIGLSREDFDPIEDFFHDVPAAVRDEALRQPEPQQSDTPFDKPWPLDHWPDVPTRVIAGSDDRLFPLEFQRRVVRERLGLEVDVMPGGHLMALSRPQELVDLLVDFAKL